MQDWIPHLLYFSNYILIRSFNDFIPVLSHVSQLDFTIFAVLGNHLVTGGAAKR